MVGGDRLPVVVRGQGTRLFASRLTHENSLLSPTGSFMNASTLFGLLLIGTVVGVCGGLLGIGGGVLVIPLLTFFFGYTQRQAVGTSLGMLLPPIGVFAFLQYYRAGQVDLRAAAVLAAAFAAGAWGGGWLANSGKVPDQSLRLLFAIFLLYVGGSILFRSDPRASAVLRTLLTVGSGLAAYGMLRLIGRRWDRRYGIGPLYRSYLRRPPSADYEI